VSGAAPAVTLAEIVTLGGSAFAVTAPASIARTTTPAARNTDRSYSLIQQVLKAGYCLATTGPPAR
jgi:hypothetical protein